ncbi:hypothetical protein ACFV1W_20125 [Kitasatospora sp. NPDC059648]
MRGVPETAPERVCTAEPGSASEEGLRLLSSWGATREAVRAPE